MANKTLQLKISNTTYRSSVDNTLTNEDLNNVKLPGLYNAGGSNSVTNKPSGVDHFGLLVIHRASGAYYVQIIYNDTKSFRRFCTNDTWSSWKEDKLTDTTYTSLKNPCALTLKINSGGGTAYDGSSPITYDITKTSLGLNKVDNIADVDKSVKHAKTADSATTASKLGANSIGSNSCGIYLSEGKPVKMNATVGDARTPIYFLNGTATACNLTKASVGLSVVDNTSDDKKEVATALAVRSSGTVAANTSTTSYSSGLRFHTAYNNGYPESYGNCITLTGSGDGEFFCGWSGEENASTHKTSVARLYYRNKRDTSTAVWSDWCKIAFTSDIPTSFAWGSITGKPVTYPPNSHSHPYLPLSGGTMSGQVRSSKVGSSWISSRDQSVAVASAPSTNSYNCVVSQLTGSGEWSIGNLYGEESLTLSYTENANYNKGNNANVRVTIDNAGGAHFNAVYNAVYNDYAEFFPRGEATEPGDIVALDLTSDHESYIKATATSKIVAGVHSDEYAMLIGGDKVDDGNYVEKNLINYIPVSLAGRVMCKVTGPVHRGDTIIVSDIPGVGIATDDENIPHKRVVGYVVEDDDRTDIRRVKIRVKG